jgi:ATP-dependent DNA ligase
MSLRPRALPAGFIAPCLPSPAPQPPCGELWLHEIKHDGFRVIARKDGKRVRLYSRPGNDLTWRFPFIVEALATLRSRSCIIDGEAVSCGPDGIANFDRIRYRRNDADAFMWAFDLIELNRDDLRREPLAVRKATLERMIVQATPGIRVLTSTSSMRDGSRSSFIMRASWGWKALCRNAATRLMLRAARRTGSSRRTRVHQRWKREADPPPFRRKRRARRPVATP